MPFQYLPKSLRRPSYDGCQNLLLILDDQNLVKDPGLNCLGPLNQQ
jgi:hypothetical protein